MSPDPPCSVAITGLGIVTALGNEATDVLRRVQAGDSAAAPPTEFDATGFACPVCAEVRGFEPHHYAAEAKMVRLMNRDAQLAVAGARLALQNADVIPDRTYPAEEIGLFGATGLAGLPLREVLPLLRHSRNEHGEFDLARFGDAGLKAVSPILSFKILSNMPLCFVSINEGIRGANAIYTPWEGDGAQAIEEGIRAVRAGEVKCAVVGGCDVKTHEVAFATLQQLGLFSGWEQLGHGCLPGEGAAFLVLEPQEAAVARGARVHARVSSYNLRPVSGGDLFQTRLNVLKDLDLGNTGALVSSASGDELQDKLESSVLEALGISFPRVIQPKKGAGDLFAAAAPLQMALAATLIDAGEKQVLANCFGYGSTLAAFLVESA